MVEYIVWGLLLLGVLVVGLALWRFLTQRARGTQVIVRRLPANDGRAWRHGIIRYRGDVVECFKLRSLSPSPDIVLRRDEIVLSSRRKMTTIEQKFMEPDTKIVVIKTHRGTCEWAMDPHAEMALLAWLESAPTQPIVRMSPQEAMKIARERRRSS
ncbi:DUF2550 domain-containing protein [Corynebacterium epidermidicanis]|uniref:Putative DUF2550 family protein n=1 Tax=Corynebacterium epidermidicanis TaxID=1050174 RepID=A0A0G3GTL2_9CORY|nr:DUF2550 domain-containing protein [Corynebacterium epidermidicanis]AKK02893.1 putative DUF2550 family protein [Corynebacterium epidermidicanis]